MSSESNDTRRAKRLGTLRWSVAAALLLVTFAAAIMSLVETCEHEVVVLESEVEMVEVCGPANFTDPRYIFAVLFTLILISPELSEFSVGSISIKRRLDNSERQQHQIRTDVEGLRQQLLLQANQQVFVQVPTYVNPQDPQLSVGLAKEGFDVSSTASETSAISVDEIKVRLLDLFERLRLFDRRLTRLPESHMVLRPGEGYELEAWGEEIARVWPEARGLGISLLAEQSHVFTQNFLDTLDTIRAVRNAVAHAKPVDEGDLVRTFELAATLESWLLQQIDSHQVRLADIESEGPKDIGPRIGNQ